MSKNKCDKISCAKKTSIGGQALLEGIMMRGPKHSAMAVRDPDGVIVLEKWENKKPKRAWLYKTPVLRGVFNFASSMASGYKCLMRSAEIAGLEEEEAPKKEKKSKKNKTEARGDIETAMPVDSEVEQAEQPQREFEKNEVKTEEQKPASALMTVIMLIATVLGVGLSVLLFFMLPSFIYEWCARVMPFLKPENAALSSLIHSAFEGLLKIAVLVAYMALVSLMKDIRRTFQYHGAEHKTIFCYENGLELTVDNVRKQRRFHPRCGTSFLILMLIVSIFISFFIDPLFIWLTGDVPATIIRVLIKILTIPLMMGIGYELIKLAGRHQNIFTRIISAPGVWLQHLTVLEPDDGMIECAIKAFVEVIPEDDSDKI